MIFRCIRVARGFLVRSGSCHIGYVDPIDHCVPVQISNFTYRTRSVGSLIPICQIAFDTIVVHDRRSSPEDTTWDRVGGYISVPARIPIGISRAWVQDWWTSMLG